MKHENILSLCLPQILFLAFN